MEDLQKAIKEIFSFEYRDEPETYITSSGRTEICGNHCDHQHGMVIAAAIDCNVLAAVKYRNDLKVRILSKGFPKVEMDLENLDLREEEYGTTAALVRGIARVYQQNNIKLRGFDAVVISDVPAGSGLSSSAAFEVLIGRILSDNQDPVFVARAGQYAENVYFNKPSGLMDQIACSVGGLVFMDLQDPENPVVEKIETDFDSFGYKICLVNTGGSHANLTDHYAQIPKDMASVANYFGKEYLRDVDPHEFYNSISKMRESVSDRAIMRSMHFFDEEKRVLACKEALANKDFNLFLRIINTSGVSSWRLLQNVTAPDPDADQSLALALTLSSKFLNGKGAVRVHGGGFAGTIQAFVPNDMVNEYADRMNEVFGKDACIIANISK
ncbi:MAG: galactokinase [Lachnospiraceae bacterium]|nr:galactokinase [Lachnospiraceae bacterium]